MTAIFAVLCSLRHDLLTLSFVPVRKPMHYFVVVFTTHHTNNVKGATLGWSQQREGEGR